MSEQSIGEYEESYGLAQTIEAEPVENLPAVREARELAPVEEERGVAVATDPYVGVSAVPFGEHVTAALMKHQTVPDEWLDIKPDGSVYLSHMRARNVLNEAFGFGGWGTVPVGEFNVERDGKHVTLYRAYRFYAHGRFVRECLASGDYWTSNSNSDYADAAEACESYAINRFAKFFGIAAQCWDADYREAWKGRFAHQENNQRTGKMEWKKNAGARKPTATHTQQEAGVAEPVETPNPFEGVIYHAEPAIPEQRKPFKFDVKAESGEKARFSTFDTHVAQALDAALGKSAIVSVTWAFAKNSTNIRNIVSAEEA